MSEEARMIPMDRLREAAITAVACLRLEAARQYGFINGGPEVHVDRCEEVVAQAREHGMEWTDEEVTEAGVAFVAEWNDETGGNPPGEGSVIG